MLRAKEWNGDSLPGVWQVTYKIDGIRAFLYHDKAISRSGHMLNNLFHLLPRKGEPVRDVEVYLGSFKDTQGAIITKKMRKVCEADIFSLNPIDPRLNMGVVHNPTAAWIKRRMNYAVSEGYEGLVLRKGLIWIKVKPRRTYDVVVVSVERGTGRNHSRMGALVTPMGKVGTGFTDDERRAWWNNQLHWVGSMIEVECMQLTDDGKFRHPRFVRRRLDKGVEDGEGRTSEDSESTTSLAGG